MNQAQHQRHKKIITRRCQKTNRIVATVHVLDVFTDYVKDAAGVSIPQVTAVYYNQPYTGATA